MADLMIIADDFTGGLDTGVQFARQDIPTCVITDPGTDIRTVPEKIRVLVLVLETRHQRPEEAYRTVYGAVRRAKEGGVAAVYKKTDSALRGNIGAELTAVRDALGCDVLPFLPALPRMNRITAEGIHYIDGVPVAGSVFGQDPFEPVTESDVGRLIALQSGVSVMKMPAGGEIPSGSGILVCDAASDADLLSAGEKLKRAGLLRASAGCAGFAGVLGDLMEMERSPRKERPALTGGLFVLCGSVNAITLKQLAHGEGNGFKREHIPAGMKLTEGYFDTPEGKEQAEKWRLASGASSWYILDANDADGSNAESRAFIASRGMSVEDARRTISSSLGRIMRRILPERKRGAVLITGGDTLLECMRACGVDRMEPVCELFPGIVLASFTLGGETRYVIAKSGGFGKETLLTDLKALIGN